MRRSALPAVVLALLAIVPATAIAARNAYVADTPGGEIPQLVVGVGGALSPLVVPDLNAVAPRRLTMTPDGAALYVSAGPDGDGRVLQYDVSATGTSTPKQPSSVDAGDLPRAVAVDPAGKTLYVADEGDCEVLQFAIGAGGRLELLDTLPLHGPPQGLAVAPDGGHLYVTVDKFAKRITIESDGRLDPASLEGLDTGGDLTDVALTPDGRHLYAASRDSRVFQFEVADDGVLTPLSPADVPVSPAVKLAAIAIGPDGGSLYAAGSSYSNRSTTGHLLQFTIGAAGELTPKDPAGLTVPGAKLSDLAFTPDGRSIYAAGGDLHLFDVGPSGLATAKVPSLFDLSGAAGVVVSPNQAPIASFETALAPAGSAVSFDAGAAADPDGSITRYDWDFGDGTVLDDGGPVVSHVYSAPGSYEVRLVVTDNEGASTRTVFTGTSVLGNGAPTAETVRRIDVPAAALQQAAPAPPVTPEAPPAQVARPELGETILVEPDEGRVFARVPGATRFVRIETLRVLPVGSVVDARRGKAVLSTVRDRRGDVQQGYFFDGVFQVRQRRSQGFVTELVLRGEIGPCAGADRRARASRSRGRRLWGNAKGRYRTQGRYSSGAVRGTRWLVSDTCEGTLTVVRRGRVQVRDFVRDDTRVLEAGERYLAKPR